MRLYVIWEPVWPGDIEAKAKRAATELGHSTSRTTPDSGADGKLSQFWTPDMAIARALIEPLGWGSGRQRHANGDEPWDLYAAFPAGVRWEAGAALPSPSAWASPIVADEHLADTLRESSEPEVNPVLR